MDAPRTREISNEQSPVHNAAEQTSGVAASGWLLSLNTQWLNDCCDQEQTVKNITGRFSAPQELTQLPWSLVDNGA